MMRMPRSLFGRMMLSAMTGLLTALAVALSLCLLVWPTPSDYIMRSEVIDQIDDIDRTFTLDADGRPQLELKSHNANSYDGMPKDAAYRVTDARGAAVLESLESPALEALRAAPPGADTVHVPNGEQALVLRLERRTVIRDGQPYLIEVVRSERLVTALQHYASKLYLRAGSVAVVLALVTFAVVAFLTTRRLVQPLRRASTVAAGIGPRNLSARLHVDEMPSELQPMIDTLNAALARLEQGFRIQQDFLATAAHELKTPLSLLQAEIELGTPDREAVLRDIAMMARQVNQLLHLAEASEGHNYRFSQIAMHEAASDAVDYLTRVADRRNVHLQLEIDDDAHDAKVEADAGAVFMLIKNLLENAVQHTPAGGKVVLHLGPHSFQVVDDGPGIPETGRAHLFERFRRGEQAPTGGAGLGLAICREICHALGWDIRIAPSSQNEGARFVVTFSSAESHS